MIQPPSTRATAWPASPGRPMTCSART
jgi:hypothetical protein